MRNGDAGKDVVDGGCAVDGYVQKVASCELPPHGSTYDVEEDDDPNYPELKLGNGSSPYLAIVEGRHSPREEVPTVHSLLHKKTEPCSAEGYWHPWSNGKAAADTTVDV